MGVSVVDRDPEAAVDEEMPGVLEPHAVHDRAGYAGGASVVVEDGFGGVGLGEYLGKAYGVPDVSRRGNAVSVLLNGAVGGKA